MDRLTLRGNNGCNDKRTGQGVDTKKAKRTGADERRTEKTP